MAHQLDYHASTDQLSVGGQISDQTVKGPLAVASQGNPYLALYVGPYYIYSWGKWVNVVGSVQGLQFSQTGKIIVAVLDVNQMLFLRAVDGGLINSIGFGGGVYDDRFRNIAIT